MHFPSRFQAALLSKLGVIVLMALLLGCATRVTPPRQPIAHGPTKGDPSAVSSPTRVISTPAKGVAPGSAPPANLGVSFDVKGVLHIQSLDGIGCRWDQNAPDRMSATSRPFMPNDLVVLVPQQPYATSVFQQLASYVDARWKSASQPQSPSLPPLPSGFITIPGSATGVLSNCDGTLDITNISPNPIQLSGVRMRLVQASQTNTSHYQLVDACSLPLSTSTYLCPRGNGGGGALDYEYSFGLEGGNAETVFEGKQSTLGPGPTLNPGQAVTIYVAFSSTRNLLYTVRPELVIDTLGEQRTIELPQLTSEVAFADPNQFSCYTAQGNQFRPVEIDSLDTQTYCL